MSDVHIVFSGKTDVWWLRLLRPGFRHCFALVREADRWIVVDPMLHKMDVMATQCPHDFDLPAWMRARGYRVLRAPLLAPLRRVLAPAPFTCVEAMKRLIGLQEWRIFTPWQLYRRLVTLNSLQGETHGKPVFQTKDA